MRLRNTAQVNTITDNLPVVPVSRENWRLQRPLGMAHAVLCREATKFRQL